MTLNDVMVSTSHCQLCVRLCSKLMTGGKPARIKNKHATTEMMKLTTWLRVMAEVIQLTARYAPAISQLPTYAAEITPLSELPRWFTVHTTGNVSTSARPRKSHDAMNFPTMASHGAMGMVSSNSSVPTRRSSAQDR